MGNSTYTTSLATKQATLGISGPSQGTYLLCQKFTFDNASVFVGSQDNRIIIHCELLVSDTESGALTTQHYLTLKSYTYRRLLKSDLRCLDAFHCRSLRNVLKIPSSYDSRISNEDVLRTAGVGRLSTMLQERQAKLYERITKMPHESLVRRIVCDLHAAPVKWHARRG